MILSSCDAIPVDRYRAGEVKSGEARPCKVAEARARNPSDPLARTCPKLVGTRGFTPAKSEPRGDDDGRLSLSIRSLGVTDPLHG